MQVKISYIQQVEVLRIRQRHLMIKTTFPILDNYFLLSSPSQPMSLDRGVKKLQCASHARLIGFFY